MTRSEYYFKKAKQIIQKNTDAPAEKTAAEIRECLFTFLEGLSGQLKHEIFQFYYEKWLETGDPSLYKLAEMPQNIIDLFHGDVDGLVMDFSDEEWMLVREVVDVAADEMNLNLLNKLVGILTEKGVYDKE